MKNVGFTLPEMLVALAIGSVLLIGTARMLPVLQMHTARILMMFQLQEEMAQMMATLEKHVRRAGYCHGRCIGDALKITNNQGTCLLVRWDENSNGKWAAAERHDSDIHAFRLRGHNLETQRGVADCDGGGWEKLNDPAVIVMEDFQAIQQAEKIRLRLRGKAKAFLFLSVTLERWVTAVNL